MGACAPSNSRRQSRPAPLRAGKWRLRLPWMRWQARTGGVEEGTGHRRPAFSHSCASGNCRRCIIRRARHHARRFRNHPDRRFQPTAETDRVPLRTEPASASSRSNAYESAAFRASALGVFHEGKQDKQDRHQAYYNQEQERHCNSGQLRASGPSDDLSILSQSAGTEEPCAKK